MNIKPETNAAEIIASHEKRLHRVEQAALAAVLAVWLDVAVELVHELVEQFFAGRNKECGRG